MFQKTLKKIFGSRSDREINRLVPVINEINQTAKDLQGKSDEELKARTNEMIEEISSSRNQLEIDLQEKDTDPEEIKKTVYESEQKILDSFMIEAFAIVKDTCRRLCGTSWTVAGRETVWEMIPYDVQLIGAIVLHRGNVAEMKTGEGKTLAATMPIFLNALTGRGVHIVTVNDYLARRDAEWMGEVFKRLGLTVGYMLNTMDNNQRRAAYNCDITYGTNNEFGFDYLRDNMSLDDRDQVQRDHAFAIVDEVDSVLIDEARTPLIISGSVDAPVDKTYSELKPLIQDIVRKQNALISELVDEAQHFLKENKEDEAGLKLLQARRGLPKHRKLMKIFQEPGTIKLSQKVESDYMRDKRLHEVDDDLFFSIDEKSHIIDITEKGRQVLSPNRPEMFIIPDLGEMISEI